MNVSMEKPHLSYSQINTYLTCPLKYKFHYIDQIEPPFVSSALVFGSCIHEAVAAFYQSCLEGDPLSPGQVHDVYRQAWESHSKERPIRFFNNDAAETLTTKAKSMLEVFHESFDPSAQIIGIEEPFEVDLGKRIPPLVGWIDAVELAPDGTVSVIDLKTASKRYSDNTVHSNVQLTCYSLGAQSPWLQRGYSLSPRRAPEDSKSGADTIRDHPQRCGSRTLPEAGEERMAGNQEGSLLPESGLAMRSMSIPR